jgi:hypothetical protein
VQAIKEKREMALNERRKRLAELYTVEEAQYERELKTNIETPEQVREKMGARLIELKEKREVERLEMVSQCTERQFRMTNDELRLADKDLYERQTLLAREDQLKEKKDKISAKIMEEHVYSALWEQDRNKKLEREEREKKYQKELKSEMLGIVDWQN